MSGALILALSQFFFARFESFEFNGAQRFCAELLRSRFAVLPQLIVFAANQFMLNAGVAHNNRLPNHWRLFDLQRLEIDAHDVPGFSKERGYLIEQAGLDADKLVFGRLAEFREI